MIQYLKIKVKLWLLVGLLVSSGSAAAQKTYMTRQGFMVIKTYEGDSLKNYRFNNIIVLLDYEKATVDLSFKLDDSLEDIVPTNRFFSDHDAKITTRLSIPKIETQPHPDWNFSTKGELYYDEKVYYMSGNGELRHHDGSETLACYLMLKLQPIDGVELIMNPFGKVQELHLFQAVLNHVILDDAGINDF
ncbi:hypothetical protein [Ekhidna sp.]|jgi:hypothetical protein|uniref:hypothetical protein n=1 Tax=Ekhidna sp. TaxID=2608089 RepID=UPI0032EC930D